MTMAQETDEALLLDELRGDTELDGRPEREALSRVEQRLMLRVIEGGMGNVPVAPRARSLRLGPARWWRGARGGMAVALLVGTALGAGGHAVASYVMSRVQPVAPTKHEPALKGVPAVARQAPEPVVSGQADAATAEAEAPSTDTVELAEPQLPSTKSPSLPASGRLFEQELAELEVARRAVSRGEGASALRVLGVHSQRYPGSILAQEREALTVKALVLAGRSDEARKLAERFRARHPNSMLLDSLERALRSIP
jgi:hypothetical protein